MYDLFFQEICLDSKLRSFLPKMQQMTHVNDNFDHAIALSLTIFIKEHHKNHKNPLWKHLWLSFPCSTGRVLNTCSHRTPSLSETFKPSQKTKGLVYFNFFYSDTLNQSFQLFNSSIYGNLTELLERLAIAVFF
ncbi:hypothetical protein GOODEAATRI_029107 [Goodea atripinnis]|uniref:Maturase K n=1 Tax=Goodea atripinnis TaxID=208336 RepID=A0ABV0MMW3_9TELE